MVSLVVPSVVFKEVDDDVLIVEDATEVFTVVNTFWVNVVTEVVSNVVTTVVDRTIVYGDVADVSVVVINVVSTDETTLLSTVVLEVTTSVVEIIEVASCVVDENVVVSDAEVIAVVFSVAGAAVVNADVSESSVVTDVFD